MRAVTHFIEKKMKLVVNQEKSKVRVAKQTKFLGMTIFLGMIVISAQAMGKAMDKVEELTKRRTNIPIEKSIKEINKWYKGWSSYFSMTQYPSQFATVEAHIRRRLRTRLLRNMKRKKTIAKEYIKAGVKKGTAWKTAYSNKKWWALSHTRATEIKFSNRWFEQQGLYIRSKEEQAHWFDVKEWIKIT